MQVSWSVSTRKKITGHTAAGRKSTIRVLARVIAHTELVLCTCVLMGVYMVLIGNYRVVIRYLQAFEADFGKLVTHHRSQYTGT
jgi:hypothetical protein